MHRNTKVATCCYCGARAALVLDKARHELTCSSCGAPLHDMKMLPKQSVGSGHRELVDDPISPGKRKSKPKPSYKKSKKPKKRRRILSKIFEEAFDLVEDIFD